MSRKLSEDLNNPHLFEEYQAGVYEYEEDGLGKSATGSLKLAEEPVRDGKAQSEAGGDKRRSNDHEWGADDGGHLIGARFGGETGEANLTAQNRNLNRSDYKQMENEWAEHLNTGDKVFVHIETDDIQRPNAYMRYVIYESPDGTREWDAFHMINESRTEVAKWEADALDVGEDYAENTDLQQDGYDFTEVPPNQVAQSYDENEYLDIEPSAETASENTQNSDADKAVDTTMSYD